MSLLHGTLFFFQLSPYVFLCVLFCDGVVSKICIQPLIQCRTADFVAKTGQHTSLFLECYLLRAGKHVHCAKRNMLMTVVLCVGHGQNFSFFSLLNIQAQTRSYSRCIKNSDSFQTLKIKAFKFLITITRFQDGKMCKK